MIKAIIFDFAGVIMPDAFWRWIRNNVSDLDSKEERIHNLTKKVDIGDIGEKKFLSEVSKISGKSETIIKKEIFKLFILNSELIEIIIKLKQRYKTALLSNFLGEWLEELLTNHKLHQYFDEIIISSQHKIIKPEQEIFSKALNMLDVQSNEAIFVDDREVNLDGARKLGIKTILFQNNEQFIEDLKRLNTYI